MNFIKFIKFYMFIKSCALCKLLTVVDPSGPRRSGESSCHLYAEPSGPLWCGKQFAGPGLKHISNILINVNTPFQK